jgi:hypothetical protein
MDVFAAYPTNMSVTKHIHYNPTISALRLHESQKTRTLLTRTIIISHVYTITCCMLTEHELNPHNNFYVNGGCIWCLFINHLSQRET